MQIRRSISLLARPFQTSSAERRVWHGYSPYNPEVAYNPEVVVKLLQIYRVYYNYLQAGEDGKTPSMRAGHSDGPVELDELLAFVPPGKMLNV